MPRWAVDAISYVNSILNAVERDSEELSRYWSSRVKLAYNWQQARDKIYHETALLILVFERVFPRMRELGGAAEVMRHLIAYCDNNPNVEMVSIFPQTTPGVSLVPFVTETVFGYSSEYTTLISHIIKNEVHDNAERLPFREFERRWIMSLHGCTGRFDPPIHSSIVGKPLFASQMARSDAYALTHAIMFQTDFGKVCLSGVNLSFQSVVIDSLILRYVIEDDLDILGELVIAANCLGVRRSCLCAIAEEIVIDVWKTVGILPGPSFDPKLYQSMSESHQKIYSILECYHTTYVAVIMRLTAENNISLSHSEGDYQRSGPFRKLVTKTKNRVDIFLSNCGTTFAEDASERPLVKTNEQNFILPPRFERALARICPENRNVRVDMHLMWTVLRGSTANIIDALDAALTDLAPANYNFVVAVYCLVQRAETSRLHTIVAKTFATQDLDVKRIAATLTRCREKISL